jgi:hypothetical protein
MAANVIDFQQFKDKSETELGEMIAKEEIVLGSDADNKAFSEFAKTAPGSPEREALINGVPLPEVDGAAPVPGATEPTPEIEVEKTEPTNDFAGYSSLDELKKNFEDTRKQLEATDARHRSTNGKLGLEVKRLKEELDRQKSFTPAPHQIFDNTTSDEMPVMPTMPPPPNPEDYEDGILDSKYAKDFGSYSKEIAQYGSKVEKFNAQMKSFDSVVRKRMEPDFSEVRSLREQIQNKETESHKAQAWDGLWSDVSSIQEQYGLKTTVSLKTINDYTAVKNNVSGVNSPEEIEAADRYLKTLPPADLVAFDKIAPTINQFYDFSEGIPKKQYRTFEGFLYENGMAESFRPAQSKTTPTIQAPTAPVQQQNFATAMPASVVGSSDVTTRGEYSTQSELERAYSQLADESIRYPGEFNRNEAKVNELKQLEARLGFASKK